MLTFRHKREKGKVRIASKIPKPDTLQRKSPLLSLQMASKDAQIKSPFMEVAIIENVLDLQAILANATGSGHSKYPIKTFSVFTSGKLSSRSTLRSGLARVPSK